jgi:hypothetical protein
MCRLRASVADAAHDRLLAQELACIEMPVSMSLLLLSHVQAAGVCC